jgi:gamma-glutamyl hydrolase
LGSGYARISRTILELAKKTFDKGGYFPIMGMCLGHQYLGTVVNGPTEILIPTETLNMTAPLNLPKSYRESELFRAIPKHLVNRFNNTLITAHFHNFSLPFKLFLESEKLKIFYKIITTNVDRNGVEYVSTMEPKKYPFYSMQWHPENSPFEWQPKKAIFHIFKTQLNYVNTLQISLYKKRDLESINLRQDRN